MSFGSCIDCWESPCHCKGSAVSASAVLRDFGYSKIIEIERSGWKEKRFFYDVDQLRSDLERLHGTRKVDS